MPTLYEELMAKLAPPVPAGYPPAPEKKPEENGDLYSELMGKLQPPVDKNLIVEKSPYPIVEPTGGKWQQAAQMRDRMAAENAPLVGWKFQEGPAPAQQFVNQLKENVVDAAIAHVAPEYGQQWFDGWGKRLVKEAPQAVMGMLEAARTILPQFAPERIADMAFRPEAPEGTPTASVAESLAAEATAPFKTVAEMLLWLPKAGAEFISNPAKFVGEKPVDTMFLLSMLGGKAVKANSFKNLLNKDAMQGAINEALGAYKARGAEGIQVPPPILDAFEHLNKPPEGNVVYGPGGEVMGQNVPAPKVSPARQPGPTPIPETAEGARFEMSNMEVEPPIPASAIKPPEPPITYLEAPTTAPQKGAFIYDTRSKRARPVPPTDVAAEQPGPFEVKYQLDPKTGKPSILAQGEQAWMPDVEQPAKMVQKVAEPPKIAPEPPPSASPGTPGGETPGGGYPPTGKIELWAGFNPIKETKESVRRLGSLVNPNIRAEVFGYGAAQGKPRPTPEAPKIADSITPPEQGPYAAPTNGPLKVVKVKAGGTMPVYEHEIAPLMDPKLKDIKWGATKLGGEIHRAKQNPIRVFEDYPELKKTLYDPAQAAEFAAVSEYFDTTAPMVRRWHKELRDSAGPAIKSFKQAEERISLYSIGRQKGGEAILRAMGKEMPTLTPAEMKIYNEARAWYDAVLPRINEARRLAGQKELKPVEDYVTWARDLEALKEDMGIDLINDSADFLESQFSERKAMPFKYTGRKLFASKLHTDFFKIFDNYARTAIEAIHMNPIVAKSRAILEPFDLPNGQKWTLRGAAPQLAGFIEQWTNYTAGKRPEVSHPYMKFVARAASKLNKNMAMYALSANIRPALIQWTSLRNTYVDVGTRHLTEGALDNLSKSKRDFAMANSRVLRQRSQGLYGREVLGPETIIERARHGSERVGALGMEPLQFFDMEAARQSWLAYYRKATESLKLQGKEAFTYADDGVIKSQASASRSNTPPIQQSVGGRLASLFQTFVINEWNWMSKDVLGYRNPKITNVERVQKAFRLVMSTALINTFFEQVLNVESPFSAPEQRVYEGIKEGKSAKDIALSAIGEFPESIPLVGTTIKYTTPRRQRLPAVIDLPASVIQTVKKVTAGEKITTYDYEIIGKLLGVPGGAQAAKFIRRIQAGVPVMDALIGVRMDTENEKRKKSSGSAWGYGEATGW